MNITTKNAAETKKLARELGRTILKTLQKRPASHAMVISLEGQLGSGKTTFTQGFAAGLGIRERVCSPTFVLMKKYRIPARRRNGIASADRHSLYHIDCYRLKNPGDLLAIGFREALNDVSAIVLVEWGDRARKMLPARRITISFSHGAGGRSRRISIRSYGELLTRNKPDTQQAGWGTWDA